ncbi:MAG TPA: hypothetical protein VFO10_26200 [Oligoflexus sp.]|uniref:hypothetical protein n=1 Tax=Oligoflexus sp. TaxID=1971216 RepID=UPI002D808AB4|nr:hypothetical protein [Oligoflexus sp.]HET9240784.1 hypothetical protein [Oligoflexus sp.]
MNWQKKLRYRGFRLLGFGLPLLLLSVVAASFIPRRPPQILASGELSSQKMGAGQLIIPAAPDGDIPITLTLEWDRRPPSPMRLDIQISDPEGQDQLQKKIKVKAKNSGKTWQQSLMIPIPGSSVRSFTLASVSRDPTTTRYQFTAFASTPAHRILRVGEMLFYPALVFVLLALVMVLFPSFIRS